MKNAPRHSHPDDISELLSSYVDNAVDLVERRRVDKLLRECDACVAELHDLRALRQLLQSLPAPMPRRSFTLDASVAAPRMRLFPIFRFASLAAALLLFVVLGVDALGRGGQAQLSATSQPAAESAPVAQEQSRTMDSAATEAPAAAAAKEPPPAAGGAAAEATAEAAMESMPDAAAAMQAPATAAATGEEQQDAPAQDAPAEPTMSIASVDPEQDPELADQQESTAAAQPPAPMGQGGDGSIAPPASDDPDAAPASDSVLTENNTSSPDTTTLEQPRQLMEEPAKRPWQDGWRLAEILLAALVVGLGGATWWIARQERM